MSTKLIKRYGRRCLSCNKRKRSVTTRLTSHVTAPWRPDGKGTLKPTTLLCAECAA